MHDQQVSNKHAFVSDSRIILPDLAIPTQPKPGYFTEPEYEALKAMTKQELLAVENFSIRNQHG